MEEVKHKISPKFNFIYEITMPLGAKLRRSLIFIFIFILSMVGIYICKNKFNLNMIFMNFDIMTIFYWICLFFSIIFILKFFIDVILKIMQYNRINYYFYEDKIIYEDTFLNQQRKVVKYENIKEIEIRRTIWDRIMGYGIIIISTNAEGNVNSGLIIYGINNPNEEYDKINKLVDECTKKSAKNIEKQVSDENIYVQKSDENEFRESLKNIK